MKQEIFTPNGNYAELDAYIKENGIKKIFLVCGGSIRQLRINEYFGSLKDRIGTDVTRFSEFKPDPNFESAVAGVRAFQEAGCDMITAVGGGSAMDVAKCIKLYGNMDPGLDFLAQGIVPNDIPLLAVPTTAGTGSEATRYAVIYRDGEKISVTDERCIPTAVLMDPDALKTLPLYQRKATMMDALCHAVESFWSVNSTEESRKYSRRAIEMIFGSMDAYIKNIDSGNANMLMAANVAGKAINITQTTAGHAMCYKLTGLYGIAHGHAAALCVRRLWPYMLEHSKDCIDPRGEDFLKNIFSEMSSAFGCATAEAAAKKLDEIFTELELEVPKASEEDFLILKTSVNAERLKNNPVKLDEAAIDGLYREILRREALRRG